MKNTAESIFNDMVSEMPFSLSDQFKPYILEAINIGINQSHPNPTEAEINEAAELYHDYHFDGWSSEEIGSNGDHYDIGFKDAIAWLQNYQTQGREKPVENSLLIDACKYGYNYHASTQFPEMTFEENCKNNFLQHSSNWQASQPNPAIAVIEAYVVNRIKYLGGDITINASIEKAITKELNIMKETIIKQIKP